MRAAVAVAPVQAAVAVAPIWSAAAVVVVALPRLILAAISRRKVTVTGTVTTALRAVLPGQTALTFLASVSFQLSESAGSASLHLAPLVPTMFI